jgi:hypothetical protein
MGNGMFVVPAMLIMQDEKLPIRHSLGQIESAFVCPESLPTNEARKTALSRFIKQARSATPSLTRNEILLFRYTLLIDHSCTVTLERIHKKGTTAQ